MSFFVIARDVTANSQDERRKAAAADFRVVSELNGCLPFAPACWFGSLFTCFSVECQTARRISSNLGHFFDVFASENWWIGL
jgi:hypothetical protein